MKFKNLVNCVTRPEKSLPARGAWIEICFCRRPFLCLAKSLPARGAWIEISLSSVARINRAQSLPARGAWIEIAVIYMRACAAIVVAPRTGGVD